MSDATMKMFTFYATFGSGQPGYPGYYRIEVEAAEYADAHAEARRRMREATNNRWCGMYDDLEKVHESDRIFRGEA